MSTRSGLKGHFEQNDVPSIDEEHLARVSSIKESLTELMTSAYPQAYEGGFKGRPALRITIEELEAGIGRVLNQQTVDFLVKGEAQTRPLFEERGLQIVFQPAGIVPIVFANYPDSTVLMYKAVVDAQCVGCMRQQHFAPTAGLMYGVEFEVGQQRLDDLVNGGWRSLVVTDPKLAEEDGLRERLTPTCKIHGKDEVYQLAVVHQIFVANPSARNGKQTSKTEALQGSPVIEARLKTTFEYLWKYAKFLEGQRRGTPPAGIPDAFAARVRVATDKEAALAIVGIPMTAPQIDWYGAIIPQNYENGDFDAWMTAQLEGENGTLKFFKSRIAPNAIPEEKPLVTRRNGVEADARFVEVLRPFGNGLAIVNSNAVDTLVYPTGVYPGINSVPGQDRIGYEARRHERRRDTATAGDWMTAQRLAGISLDPSSVEYNNLIINRRLAETLLRK